MTISPIFAQDVWDEYVKLHENGSFLQSWNWGKFEKTLGHEPHYWGLYEDEELIGASLLIVICSKRARYIECLGGPIFTHFSQERFDAWLSEVRVFASDRNVDFVRLRLPFTHTVENARYLHRHSAKEAPLYYQAELTRRISLSDNVDTLFSKMKKKTRYEIRRSIREGVQVEKFNWATSSVHERDSTFETFWDLYQVMVKRQGYVGYSKTYLYRQFALFSDSGEAFLYLAKFRGAYVAAAIIFDYGFTTTYHHAASLPQGAVSAPAVLIWEAIKDAKGKGRMWFDLFGTAPPGWRYASRLGLTYFKEGFGGEVYQWLRTHDIIFRSIPYYFSRIVEQIPGRWRQVGRSIIKI